MQGVTNDHAPGGGLRQRKKRATRAALAEAAIRLAAEHGAENVTVEAISEAAGVSPRTFFNYFASHDDAFVVIDEGVSERIHEAVRAAPAELSPLEAVRSAFVGELTGFEERQELLNLQFEVFQRSPHLIVRGLNAYSSDERELARAVATWLERTSPGTAPAPAPTPPSPPEGAADPGEWAGADIPLFARLLAAVAHTAVRVTFEHWCARPADTDLAETFAEVFTHLAAGLRRPTD
ncbi:MULTISPECIES: TetR/AcrR family transcriptional regulator [Streptomyces]|uniref:TetR family transcriptional regulator n=1 Tax=Streptomyces evansiae TaxID=3075535 RepID=A0ABD5E2Z7_9ACTN|nr:MULTISPECIES: TetR family transcriptional regulator [unclassified Streptomyces]EFL03787.1 TetR family transcriptional regulator [Streptomyces sp. SPB78]EGJ73399.1 putative TetR family transcriptional regulator [Streptomyces sp. Tu6071]MDT0413612.1 TetR family transcriptional regulator [Streptomyces sp. DSM 41979]MDT0414675.1 TetR family transcriptional regulator [Streptomyces sp. DSM 41982]MYQ61435.1 TetR family transcriptional regulator [Streptomyces sp. SID4926]